MPANIDVVGVARYRGFNAEAEDTSEHHHGRVEVQVSLTAARSRQRGASVTASVRHRLNPHPLQYQVCLTYIKKVCRSHGIERWPFRTVLLAQSDPNAIKFMTLRLLQIQRIKFENRRAIDIRENAARQVKVATVFAIDTLIRTWYRSCL